MAKSSLWKSRKGLTGMKHGKKHILTQDDRKPGGPYGNEKAHRTV